MRALALFFGIVAAVVGFSGEHSTRDNIFVDHLEQPSKILAPGDPFSIRCVTPWHDMVNAWKKDDVVIPSGSRFAMTSIRLKSQETKNLFNALKSSHLSRKMQDDTQFETDSADDEETFVSRSPTDDTGRSSRRDGATGSNSKGGRATARLEDKLEALAKQKLELWTLKVDQVELLDSGNYSCGGDVDTYFSLKVENRKAERSEESPEESEILTNEGETEYGFHGVVVNPKSQKLVLKCNYTGERYWNEDAEPPTYQWYKNQSVITKSSKYNIQNEGPASTLTVTSCDVSDAGNYTCKFNNKQEATLAVYMYPTIDHVEGSKIQVQGDPLTLLCKARGAPTPTVTWYKEDAELETDERIQLLEVDGVANAKLVIKDLQYQDKGHYVCKAKAANVTRSVEIHVRVKDKYAALWPFLGICAEVAVLCTIIFIYERRRTKPEFEDDDDKKESSSRK